MKEKSWTWHQWHVVGSLRQNRVDATIFNGIANDLIVQMICPRVVVFKGTNAISQLQGEVRKL